MKTNLPVAPAQKEEELIETFSLGKRDIQKTQEADKACRLQEAAEGYKSHKAKLCKQC